MSLGILVGRPIDANKQALRFQIGKVLLEIEPRLSGGVCRGAGFDGLIGHRVWLPAAIFLSMDEPIPRIPLRAIFHFWTAPMHCNGLC